MVAGSSSVELAQVNTQEFVQFVSRDFERFALASKESISVALVEKDQFNLAGWPLLKLYYSAFFGAHAIMRSQGCGVVMISGNQFRHLNAIAALSAAPAHQIGAGLYTYKTVSATAAAQPSVMLDPAGGRGGVHERFWLLFCDFLDETSAIAVANRAANATEFLAGASEIANAIKGDGSIGRVWLSTMRNDINYQHKYKTWFPVTRRDEPLQSLIHAGLVTSKSIRFDLSAAKKPLSTFVNIARYVACLSSEISDFVAARSTANGTFGQKWRRLELHF